MKTTYETPITHTYAPAATEQVLLKRSHRDRTYIFRIIGYSLAAIFILSCLLTVGFHAYIAWILARPHIEPLVSDPLQAIGVAYQDVEFISRNEKTTLHGWYLPGNDTTSTVIFSHGYGGNREEIWVPIYDLAQELMNLKYNVLMFDYSYVQPYKQLIVTGGLQESDELLGAVDFSRQLGAEQIYIWGFSMGAGTALQAALAGDEIDGMILDSTFLLEPDTLYYNLRQQMNLPRLPTMALMRLLLPLVNGVGFNDIPYQDVQSTTYPIPIFFIHGDQDEKAPHPVIENIFDNQKHPATKLWIAEKGTHELIYRAQPDAYLQRTTQFLQQISTNAK